MPRHLEEAEQGDISDTQDEDEIGDDEVNEAGDESAFDEETADSEHAAGLPSFDRQQWLDLVKWAHNTDALSHEDRIRIVKLGRLIQKGRRLTRGRKHSRRVCGTCPCEGISGK